MNSIKARLCACATALVLSASPTVAYAQNEIGRAHV